MNRHVVEIEFYDILSVHLAWVYPLSEIFGRRRSKRIWRWTVQHIWRSTCTCLRIYVNRIITVNKCETTLFCLLRGVLKFPTKYSLIKAVWRVMIWNIPKMICVNTSHNCMKVIIRQIDVHCLKRSVEACVTNNRWRSWIAVVAGVVDKGVIFWQF